MGTASFKTFGYQSATSNVRVPMDAEASIQQMKAGFDNAEAKRARVSNRNMTSAIRLIQRQKKQKRRFIM